MNQTYTQCAVDGCARSPRTFSRLCQPHYQNFSRTRDVHGGIVRKGELKHFRQLARDFILQNADHAATQTALQFMLDLVNPQDTAGFLRGELERIYQAGATPAMLLASALAWFLWVEWHPSGFGYRGDRWSDCNLGRAVLGTVKGKTRISRNGKRYSVRPKGSHAETLGRFIREQSGLYLLLASKQIIKNLSAPTTAPDALREQLKVPFTSERKEDE